MMQVKCKLSTLMGENRYSIKDVHDRTGLARGTISNLYNDRATRIDYETISKLCTLFGCGINDLLTIEEITKTTEATAMIGDEKNE